MATKLARALKALQPREPTKRELYEEARFLNISGRSRMNKRALKAAVKQRRATIVTPPRI